MNETTLAILAAADPTADGGALIDRALFVAHVARVYDELFTPEVGDLVVFAADIVKVTKVIRGEGDRTVEKARIHFPPDDDHPDGETIDTGPLSNPWALYVANTAKNLIGQRALIYKNNDPDPTGKVSQGFRRCVWVTPHPEGP